MALNKGKSNCITDVIGVKVGHVTLYEKLDENKTICTGLTAILPHEDNLFYKKVRAGSAIINGYGKTTGLAQLEEIGLLEAPIMLTNTFSVGAVWQGTLEYMLQTTKDIGDTTSSINIVVGECNDSYLNSIREQAVKPAHAIQAIEAATEQPAKEGAVGAGKGMVCFGYKGGVGTASRIISTEKEHYTLGCLVVSNFGKREEALFADWRKHKLETPDGSIMMIIATDAPLYDRQLNRLAKRCAAGLGRTGSHLDNGSGDIAIAFSTANTYEHHAGKADETMVYLRDDHEVMNQLFQAVVETTEEAVIRSLKMAKTTHGRQGRTIEKAPF
ncbi:L-aminopeptidase/D-esterase [Oceanobacillus picturae]|uniref:L-aminopeptidase/D-esterase n=1 Tax=Oceanobacillus picturae TaxID=171693 RepID=W9AP39_9BACI|nr:P1 family peptidase [Oceanobacillus picturae]RIU91411.1 S58 family peptidase [Oceanobacillus picturae]CDO04406.1 L-aminopeptidase/D-esterase [Oceanobacillus picturae]